MGGSSTDRLIASLSSEIEVPLESPIESLGTLLEFQTFPFALHLDASHRGWRTPPFKREDVQVQRENQWRR